MKHLLILLFPLSLSAMHSQYKVPSEQEREEILAELNALGCHINTEFVTQMFPHRRLREVIIIFCNSIPTLRNRDTGALIHRYKKTNKAPQINSIEEMPETERE